MKSEILRFAVVGAANTLVSLLVIFGMKGFFQAGDVLANVVGYLVGLSLSFALNRSWTFRHKGKIGAAAVRFFGVFLIAYAVNLAVVLILIHWVGVNAYIAQSLGVPPYAATFFLLSKSFVFRRLAPKRFS